MAAVPDTSPMLWRHWNSDAELAIDIPARTVNIESKKSTDELANAIKALDYEVTIVDE